MECRLESSRFVTCRAGLREILELYSGVERREIKFGYNSAGKPFLTRQEGPDGIRFNLSHSGGLAVYGITRGREIGVDIQHVRPISGIDGLVNRFLSVKERCTIENLTADRRTEAFFSYWTAKEACLKAKGLSMAALPLDAVEIAFDTGRPEILSIRGDDQEAARWILEPLKLGSGFSAALVVGPSA